jgi:hypothetical protein
MHSSLFSLALTILATPLSVQADGLKPVSTSLDVSRWATRMEIETTVVRADWAPFGLGAHSSQQTARLFSDYHLDTLRLGQAGGLRLTSGLLLSQRSGSYATENDSRSAWPYLGIGYSGSGARGDWGFSADVGMAAQSLGAAVRLGRVLNGGLSVGDALRELRLQPVVRLGVSYTF